MTSFKFNTNRRAYNHFTTSDCYIIRQVYPERGVSGTNKAFLAAGRPVRTSDTIRNWCCRNAVKFVGIGQNHVEETELAWVKAGESAAEAAEKPAAE
jgi:hypothetical protein